MSAEDFALVREALQLPQHSLIRADGLAALARLEARLADQEHELIELRPYADRGDFLVHRSEWDALQARLAEETRPFRYWREINQSSLKERDMWKTRAEAAEARVVELGSWIDEYERWASSVPDAGLTSADPRYWWYMRRPQYPNFHAAVEDES